MSEFSLADLRLVNQGITDIGSSNPADIVDRLGCIQCQDFRGALWAVGLRTQQATETSIQKSLSDLNILRTWLVRGTLHFCVPGDVRWMLNLLAPANISRSSSRLRQLGLDEEILSRSRILISHVLSGGNRLSRDKLYHILESARISTTNQRGIYILWQLAQEGLICFGSREGGQDTFVLLEEWIPQTKTLDRDPALVELASRYFTSRGPASLQDFIKWSGLTASAAKMGLESAKAQLEQIVVEGRQYWYKSPALVTKRKAISASILPPFDEYLVGYRDRGAALDPHYTKQINAGGGWIRPTIVVDGQVLGTWKRIPGGESIVISPSWFRPILARELLAVTDAARRYGDFLEVPVELV